MKKLDKNYKFSKTTDLNQKHSDDYISYLLAEFQQLAESWRHTDRRIDSTINYYITIVSLLVPVSILFYRKLINTDLIYIYGISVCIALIIFGHLVMTRIITTDIRKSEYTLGMKMIRAYFVNMNNDIANYLFFNIAKPTKTELDKFKKLEPLFHRNLVIPVITVNSILAGGLFSMIWGLLNIELKTALNTLLIGIIVFLFTFIYLINKYRKIIKNFTKVPNNLENI